jgi:hypothetical protein
MLLFSHARVLVVIVPRWWYAQALASQGRCAIFRVSFSVKKWDNLGWIGCKKALNRGLESLGGNNLPVTTPNAAAASD